MMEEKEFKKLMEHSKLEIQFPGFEEEVMEAIRKKEARDKSFWRNIRWSWFLFLCGLGLGLVIMNLLPDLYLGYFGGKSKLVLLTIEIIIVAVFGLQFDNLIRITLGKKGK
jgi:hypothetical protein